MIWSVKILSRKKEAGYSPEEYPASFFLLGAALLLFPQTWSLRTWILLVMGIDLLVLGGVIAIVDAVDQGEALLPDLFRSFDFSFGTVVLFAGQVVLVILLGTGLTFPMLVLLLTIMATAIAVQTFWKQVATLVDRVAFANFPRIRQVRAELRAAATTLPRVNQTLDFETLDEVEFTRLTRRALSHFGDLSRLAASPLTYLPIVEMRLARQEAKIDTAWVAGSGILLLGNWIPFTVGGKWAVGLVSIVVALFASLEFYGAWRAR